MTSGAFRDSFALIDAVGRLVYWDDGFAHEFQVVAPLLQSGASYADIVQAAADDPGVRQVAREGPEVGNATAEYRTPEGRIIRVERRRIPSGGFCRYARDISDERGEQAAETRPRQGGNASLGAVLTETRRNPDGTYVLEPISEELRQLLDLPVEYVGQDAVMFYSRMKVTPEENARNAAQMEQSARTLEGISQDYQVRDGQDRIRWIRNAIMPRREPDGTVVFSGVLRDVTREKEAENQVELLRSVVVRSSDAIVIFETVVAPEQRTGILYVNPKFTDLFGGSAETLVGQPIEALIANDLDEIGSRLFAAALERDDGLPFEYQTLGKDRRIFWVEVRIKIVQTFDDGGFRWVVISRDVSKRRHAQDELQRAKDQAEDSSRAKSNFLANMSHELRTPLNAIIGFTELIEQGVARAGWQPVYSEYLADVRKSGRHLLDLINTILDLSKIEAGQLALNLEPVDLCELARSSLALMSGIAHDGGVLLSADIPAELPEIQGDYLKLKQMLLNIVSNAIKFTPQGGTVNVTLRFTKTHATIAVIDTGCGIPERDLERVMLPFVQATNDLARKFGGSGLGLPIARELCDLHGGRLEISSIEGQGTTVRISLPVTGKAAGPAPSPVQRKARAVARNVSAGGNARRRSKISTA